jgi:hypothetical protein
VELEMGAGDDGTRWDLDASEANPDLLAIAAIAQAVIEEIEVGALQRHRAVGAFLCVIRPGCH